MHSSEALLCDSEVTTVFSKSTVQRADQCVIAPHFAEMMTTTTLV